MRNVYEITFWSKLDKGEEIKEKIISLFKDFNFELIKENIIKSKEMSYPIQKEKIGELVTIYFWGSNEKIESFKSMVKKIDGILRFILLKRKQLKEINIVS